MEKTETPPAASGFYGLGIAPKLLEALDELKFTVPTPIQHKAIPVAAAGSDMVGIAQTGTGKTIAFAVPMLQRLAASTGKGLVLVPTRELALQVAEVVQKFAPRLGLRAAVIIGGESINRQVQELRRGPRIIIATPGRLIDHLGQRTVSLSDASVLVLDEADRMFDMGFMPQLEKIIAVLPKERQTMLFSATMPDEIMKLASRSMRLPMRVEVARPGTAAEKVVQELYIVEKADKMKLLAKLLDKYWGSVLLFIRTKHNAKKIARQIREMPHSAAEIHSNRSLNQRKDALEGFKSGKYRVLVATDIAARGIDVTGIELVVNYDLPDEDGNYVHRIGRTGRAGQPGHAITFATPDQGSEVRAIEKLIRMQLTPAEHPDVPSARFGAGAPQPQRPQPQRQPRRQEQPRQGQQPRRQPGRPQEQGRSRPQAGSRGAGHGPQPRRAGQDGRRHEERRYGHRPQGHSGRPSIVEDSPYFEEPRRGRGEFRRPSGRQERPEQPKPQQAQGGWLSKLFKKTPR